MHSVDATGEDLDLERNFESLYRKAAQCLIVHLLLMSRWLTVEERKCAGKETIWQYES